MSTVGTNATATPPPPPTLVVDNASIVPTQLAQSFASPNLGGGCTVACVATLAVMAIAGFASVCIFLLWRRRAQWLALQPNGGEAIDAASLFRAAALPADVGFVSPSAIVAERGPPYAVWFGHAKAKPRVGDVSKAVVYAGVSEDLQGQWRLRLSDVFRATEAAEKSAQRGSSHADVLVQMMKTGLVSPVEDGASVALQLAFADNKGNPTSALFHSTPTLLDLGSGRSLSIQVQDGLLDFPSSRLQFTVVLQAPQASAVNRAAIPCHQQQHQRHKGCGEKETLMCFGYLILPQRSTSSPASSIHNVADDDSLNVSNLNTLHQSIRAKKIGTRAAEGPCAVELEMGGHWVSLSDLGLRGEFRMASKAIGSALHMSTSAGGRGHITHAPQRAATTAISASTTQPSGAKINSVHSVDDHDIVIDASMVVVGT